MNKRILITTHVLEEKGIVKRTFCSKDKKQETKKQKENCNAVFLSTGRKKHEIDKVLYLF